MLAARRFDKLAADANSIAGLSEAAFEDIADAELAVAGAVRAALSRDHDLALAAVERATTVSPNAAVVLGFDALTRCLCGDHEKAIARAEKAMQLSPLEPLVYYAAFACGFASILTGRSEEAVAYARKAIEGNRNFAFSYCVLALGCARLGQREEAARAVRRLAVAAPGFRIEALSKIRFADAALLQPELALLRAAQLPD